MHSQQNGKKKPRLLFIRGISVDWVPTLVQSWLYYVSVGALFSCTTQFVRSSSAYGQVGTIQLSHAVASTVLFR